ncbi:MAG: YjbQ family protein [Desulfovibrionaceae bacterium]|nr:YjbQ family protein [Desulfovibrionaceae bacterium]
MEALQIRTTARQDMVNVTREVQRLVEARGWTDGALVLFCPHTTGALTINEAADPDVVRDIKANLAALVPERGDYRHAEGNSDAHIKTSLVGPSLTVIVEDGRVQLGTWQGIFFCEYDGPRARKLWVKWLSA